MKTNSIFSATLALALCCVMVLLSCPTLLAQDVQNGDPHPDTTTVKKRSGVAASMSSNSYTASDHSGASPWPTPTPSDQEFVVDTGSGLDTNCQFRSQGSLKFTIDVTRVVGSGDVGAVDGDGKLVNPQQMVNNGIVSKTAILTMPAFDVDFNTPTSEGQPERDRILFNGQSIGNLGSERYLMGENDKWRMNLFQVPIELVHFARENGLSPIPGHNEIEILIDQANIANNKELWCTAIDWASLKFKALAPVVMVHGNGESGEFWNRLHFTDPFKSAGIAFDNSISLPTTFLAINSALLLPYIQVVAIKFGVNHIHLVCHSKGGLDTRGWLKLIPTQNTELGVLSMTTLSTPHHGSALADYIRDSVGASAYYSENTKRVGAMQLLAGRYDEGRQNLTTDFVAGFNASNLPLPQYFTVHGQTNNVQYFTFGADTNLDDSFSFGKPTISYQELAGTGKDGYWVLSSLGGTLVYRTLYYVSSTYWDWRYVGGERKRIVREVQNAEVQPNDILVTITSSKLEPQFLAQPSVKKNHGTVADAEMGQTVLSLIKAAQSIQW